jgi:predicted hydrocarbon binding protein
MDEKLQKMIEKYELAVAFAKEFMTEIGEERSLKIISLAFEKMQVNAGRDLAKQLGSNTLEALAGYFRKLEGENDNLEVLEVTDRHIALKVSRCRAWEAFQKLGVPEVCQRYCDSDHAFIKAFNPKMKLIRTKVIAAGDDYCDHIWAMRIGDAL